MSPAETLSPDELSELSEIVREVLGGIVSTATEATPVTAPAEVAATTLDATVGICGDASAALTVRVDGQTGANLAVAWFGLAADTLSIDDLHDTMAEFANVLGGTAKSLFPAETALEVPTVTIADTGSINALDGAVIVQHDLGQFEVVLC